MMFGEDNEQDTTIENIEFCIRLDKWIEEF